MAIAYLSWTTFDVGRQSQFDHLLMKFSLSTWQLTFWRLLKGESVAAAPSFLCLQHPTTCISGLAVCRAGGDCWRSWVGLGEAGSGSSLSSAALDGPGSSHWSSLAAFFA